MGRYSDPLIIGQSDNLNETTSSIDLVGIEIQANEASIQDNQVQWKVANGEAETQVIQCENRDDSGDRDIIVSEEVYRTVALQLEEHHDNPGKITEEVTPLGIQLPEEENGKIDTVMWIQQNIIRLSKEFGVDFNGREERVAELFLKIDSIKKTNREGETKQKTVKKKGSNELKNLELDINFLSNGTRSRKGT